MYMLLYSILYYWNSKKKKQKRYICLNINYNLYVCELDLILSFSTKTTIYFTFILNYLFLRYYMIIIYPHFMNILLLMRWDSFFVVVIVVHNNLQFYVIIILTTWDDEGLNSFNLIHNIYQFDDSIYLRLKQ